MQITDPVADMLTRIRNANTAKHESVDVPASNLKKAIAKILLDEGYIKSYEVVEGIMIFVDKTLCDEMNIRIFVDADADVRLCRRIRRDVKKRGRSIDSVIDQYLTTVKPMHELYVEPSKKNANLIVPEGGKNLIALEMIINRIQRHIDGNAE